MKALSVYQPHASLIPLGKPFELRPWATKYRGPLLICAAQIGAFPGRHRRECIGFIEVPFFRKILSEALGVDTSPEIYWRLPFGQAVATVNLVDCVRIGDLPKEDLFEVKRWNPFEGLPLDWFAWNIQDCQAIKKPFPITGRQRLFEVDDALLGEWSFCHEQTERRSSRSCG